MLRTSTLGDWLATWCGNYTVHCHHIHDQGHYKIDPARPMCCVVLTVTAGSGIALSKRYGNEYRNLGRVDKLSGGCCRVVRCKGRGENSAAYDRIKVWHGRWMERQQRAGGKRSTHRGEKGGMRVNKEIERERENPKLRSPKGVGEGLHLT